VTEQQETQLAFARLMALFNAFGWIARFPGNREVQQ
jgi:hypothetical protein